MYWPANYLTSPIQRLGGSDTQRAALDALIAGFNAGRFEAVGEYYCEDAVVEYPPGQKYEGRKQIIEAFVETGKTVTVSFEILKAICDDSGICLVLTETFSAVGDASSFLAKPLRPGESHSRKIIVLMSLQHGLISKSSSTVID